MRVASSGTVNVMTCSFQSKFPSPVRTTLLRRCAFLSSPTCTYQPASPFTFSPRTRTRIVTCAPGMTVKSERVKPNQDLSACGPVSAFRQREPEKGLSVDQLSR